MGSTGKSIPHPTSIETSINIDKVLEERILDSEVKFTLREVFGIAKKETRDKVIEIIKRKKQMIDDAGDKGVGNSLLTHAANYVSSSNGCCVGSEEENLDAIKGHFSRKHWARSTTEAPVKIEGLSEPLLALIDQGFEINVMSGDVYRKGGWPIETSHGWRVRMATTSTGDLFGAVPNIPVMIGDVQVEQHFFVQEECS